MIDLRGRLGWMVMLGTFASPSVLIVGLRQMAGRVDADTVSFSPPPAPLDAYLAYVASIDARSVRLVNHYRFRTLAYPRTLSEQEAEAIVDAECVTLVEMHNETLRQVTALDGSLPSSALKEIEFMDSVRVGRIKALREGEERDHEYHNVITATPTAQRADATCVVDDGRVRYRQIRIGDPSGLTVHELRDAVRFPNVWRSSHYPTSRLNAFKSQLHCAHLYLEPLIRTWDIGPINTLNDGTISFELHAKNPPQKATPGQSLITRVVVVAQAEDGLPIRYEKYTAEGKVFEITEIGPYEQVEGVAWPSEVVTTSYRADVQYGGVVDYPNTVAVTVYDEVTFDVETTPETFAFSPPQND